MPRRTPVVVVLLDVRGLKQFDFRHVVLLSIRDEWWGLCACLRYQPSPAVCCKPYSADAEKPRLSDFLGCVSRAATKQCRARSGCFPICSDAQRRLSFQQPENVAKHSRPCGGQEAHATIDGTVDTAEEQLMSSQHVKASRSSREVT